MAHRFALNDTHDGYTAPYADWPRWERLIDVLALHGCNEVLVTAGQEAVYHRLLQDFGYTDDEARAWLPAPSHQPWWLLQNMSGYGGPLSPGLIGRRAALGRRIADRMRELGIAPVLPGYFGTVPDGFTARNPGARTVPQGTWNGLRRPDWLDPRTPSSPRWPPPSTGTRRSCSVRRTTSRWICCTRAAPPVTSRCRTPPAPSNRPCTPRTPARPG